MLWRKIKEGKGIEHKWAKGWSGQRREGYIVGVKVSFMVTFEQRSEWCEAISQAEEKASVKALHREVPRWSQNIKEAIVAWGGGGWGQPGSSWPDHAGPCQPQWASTECVETTGELCLLQQLVLLSLIQVLTYLFNRDLFEDYYIFNSLLPRNNSAHRQCNWIITYRSPYFDNW